MGPQYTPYIIDGQLMRWKNGAIGKHLNGRDMADWEPLFVVIRNSFRDMGVLITEVMYWRDCLVVILERWATDTAKLPTEAGNLDVKYCYEYEMERPSTPQSLCETDPILGNQVEVKRLTPIKGRRTGEFVSMESSGTGVIEGSFKVSSFQRVDDQWVFTIWLYMGQDSADDGPPPTYGSAIWTAGGDVLGFVRYAPRRGLVKDWCAGIAADEFIDRGFTTVDAADR